jgi:hypothetical protein
MKIRNEYLPVVSAVELAGYYVTSMPMDGGGDRIVCADRCRDDGSGLTGNSFWLAESNGKWFLGAWGGQIYRLSGVTAASEIAISWLTLNSVRTDSDVPDELKLQYGLCEVSDDDYDALV